MNKRSSVSAWLVVAVLPFVAAVTQAVLPVGETTDDGDVRPIRGVLDDQVAAWNRRDLEGFMETYWKSPELVFFSGKDKTRGWDATLERFRKRYQAEGREMGTLSFHEVDVEMLGPGSAYVRGRWQLVMSKETVGGLFTLIVKKLPDGWRIVHDHTSV